MAGKKSTAIPGKLPRSDQERAERANRLRRALGYPQSSAFATFLRVSPQRWNNVENGKPLGSELAIRVVRAVPGLTLDWLYFGKADGMPFELARRLGETGPPGTRRSSTA
jgi:transcriptional regulator with XRE-family HTH domain